MKRIALSFIFIALLSVVKGQNLQNNEKVNDTIITKSAKLLSLDKQNLSYLDRIRIIDLTKSIGLQFRNYMKFPIITKTSLPYNLKNGENRDIIITFYKNVNKIITIRTIINCYEANNEGIHIPYSGLFTFRLIGSKVKLLNSKIENIDDWDGY